MGIVLNIRGTNGSGKTTLARHFLPPNLKGDDFGGPVDLNQYDAPTKRDPDRKLRVTGYMNGVKGVGVVGPYNTACGGLDGVPSFPVQFGAIRVMLERFRPRAVIAEGILASTVFGSWGEFAKGFTGGDRFAFAYLQTPLDVCLERIKARQAKAGKVRDIKEDLVADKVKAIAATRLKALQAGMLVYDLPFGHEVEAAEAIIAGYGEAYAAHA